jgi:DNA-binding GntR family transcriptional regulator
VDALANLPPAEGLQARQTTPDRVADLLREAILTGRLADGAELNQVALSEHFAVSRVPIREALRQLQAEGLIRQEAHRRAVVSTLSHDHIVELFDLRVVLETYMLRRAMERMDVPSLSALEDRMSMMRQLGADDHERWLEANREFHELLYRPSGASFTRELAAGIAARTTRYLYLRTGGSRVQRQAQAHREHERIMDAVREGKADEAVLALEEHINGTRRAVLAVLEERAGSGHE